jgi:hypothetical protein
MWVRYDYTMDQPSVQPEGSSKVGLGHTVDDGAWGRNVDQDEGGYSKTWVSLALGESCYYSYAT